MQVPVTFWTSAAALVVSLITASVTFLQAVRGPQIQMLPLDSVFVFASPDGPELLGAVLQTDIARKAAAGYAPTDEAFHPTVLDDAV